MRSSSPYIGRFAPSPTGPLHMGSLATALGSFLDARLHRGQWLLRIEDIDAERCDQQSVEHILHTLRRHGLNWDGEALVQSTRHALYQQALDQLDAAGLVFPCACTRKDIEQANAHRAFGENRIYPGTCSLGMPKGKKARAIRFRCPAEAVKWSDWHAGDQLEHLPSSSGDFVLKRGDGFWAYHLAVVVDDRASEVTHIVRGEDLLDTTARQVALWSALNANDRAEDNVAAPSYWHLPVILAPDGQKLSKQTGALAVPECSPTTNLNVVWKHFGMPPIQADNVDRWLRTATSLWVRVRQQFYQTGCGRNTLTKASPSN